MTYICFRLFRCDSNCCCFYKYDVPVHIPVPVPVPIPIPIPAPVLLAVLVTVPISGTEKVDITYDHDL